MIFVTGGTGLLGRHIIGELRARGHTVRALARDAAGAARLREFGAEPVPGVVEDPAAWDAAEGCAALVHGAAIVAGRLPWERFRAVNVEATRHAAARARGLGVPLVHVSSVAVYGRRAADDAPESVGEDYAFGPLDEADFYARSKRQAEEAVWSEVDKGLRAVAVRPCVVYGEGDRLFLPKLLRVARRGWLPLLGPGDRPMALVHARNVAQAVAQALDRPAAWGRAYNLTNDDAITAREFVEALALGLGTRIRTLQLRPSLALALAGGGERLLRLLGPGRYPGTLRGAVRFWRGGNPYRSTAAVRDLGWRPAIAHREAVPEAVRAALAGG